MSTVIGQVEMAYVNNCFKIFVPEGGKKWGNISSRGISKKGFKRWEVVEHVYLLHDGPLQR